MKKLIMVAESGDISISYKYSHRYFVCGYRNLNKKQIIWWNKIYPDYAY